MAGFEGSYAYPNPARRGGELKISYPVSASYSCGARLYNLAGELIGWANDPAQSGTLSFGTRGLSSGVYVVKLEKFSGGTGVARAILKVSIVQ